MALAPLPAWTQVNPLDFVNAASTGARLGLERSQIQTGAQDAADRLRLGYAQLASENARSGAALGAEMARAHAADMLRNTEFQSSLQQWAAEQALRKQQADTMEKYRQDEVAARNRQIDAVAAFHKQEINNRKSALALQLHKMMTTKKPGSGTLTFNGVDYPYLTDPTTGHPYFPPVGNTRPGAMSDMDKANLKLLSDEQTRINKKWADPFVAAKAQTDPKMKDDYAKDQARLLEIHGQIKGLITPKSVPGTPAADTLQPAGGGDLGGAGPSAAETLTADTGGRGEGGTNAPALRIMSIRPAGTGADGAAYPDRSPIPGVNPMSEIEPSYLDGMPAWTSE